jgi:hypothetical protein
MHGGIATHLDIPIQYLVLPIRRDFIVPSDPMTYMTNTIR